MNLAIIPARKGSKRIPKKNIKHFFGKPVIYYSIKQAKLAKVFDKIIVSTDCKKIANISEKYGAEIPFIRPKKISGDYTSTSEVIKHAINYYRKKNIYFKFVCCIYPVAPFLLKKDILKGLNKIKKGNWSYVFSATKNNHPYYRSFIKNKSDAVKMIFPNYYNKRTQDLKITYYDSGQFYWGSSQTWLNKKKVFDNKSTIIEIPRDRSIDVDTLEDWKFAEQMMFIKK
ncbi:MAG: CMP-N,N'-diacetyllegionaminic acid synthase [Alphaproteobacteria bacterium MarineAlpha5_Bin8]|nr:MAG: CMP-N,N'-diacetyllegionaminic acid synthase [Alphaproteobacteria bacterium MarineAlpha5_Bin8]PPR54159.1 MAG: CMP-N,N'-diacetyllegionaminic acid synthase [Alphaproteobacteria bacterium MarineAlpha5_Bin6]|tara:strand:- start:3185 stop:3868 length:684 start_codon:yes stop_codon:yes gene_type:complete